MYGFKKKGNVGSGLRGGGVSRDRVDHRGVDWVHDPSFESSVETKERKGTGVG